MGLLYNPSTVQEIPSLEGGAIAYVNNTVKRCQGIYWTSSGIKEVFDYTSWIMIWEEYSRVSVVTGTTVTFLSSVRYTGGSYYWWQDGVFNDIRTSSMSISFSTETTHTYYATYIYNGGAVFSNEITISWVLPTTVGVSIQSTATNVEPGNSVTLSTVYAYPSGGSYQWYRDGTMIAGSTSSSYQASYSSPTTHTYYLVYNTGGQSVTSNSITVTWGYNIYITTSAYILSRGQVATLRCYAPAGSQYNWIILPSGYSSLNDTLIIGYSYATTVTIYCDVVIDGVSYRSNTITITWT